MLAIWTLLQVVAIFGMFWLMSASTLLYVINNAPAWEDKDERHDEK